MYAEGETELRDLIIQNLESSGFLNKIKAELRAGVFIAFEDEGKLKTKNPLANNKFEEFIETSSGKLVFSLVREFLEYFNLNFTLSVFDPETSTSSCLNRADLCEKLSLKTSEVKGPVLSALLKADSNATGKETKKQSNGANSFAQSSTVNSLNSKKSLETISEDIAVKETEDLSKTFDVGNNSLATKANSGDFITNEITSSDSVLSNSGSEMIDKLRNEHNSFELNKKESLISDIFGTSKSNTDIFKVSTSDDLDTFFDEPLPSQKTSIFSETGLGVSSNNPSENKPSSKFLPAIETPKKKDLSFDSELLDALSSIKSLQKKEPETKSELDAESNEESSDRQLNSEESIEEEIEENFSEGLDDLLNSSLSLGDDATTDQSASQVSVVDGVDHIESVAN